MVIIFDNNQFFFFFIVRSRNFYVRMYRNFAHVNEMVSCVDVKAERGSTTGPYCGMPAGISNVNVIVNLLHTVDFR